MVVKPYVAPYSAGCSGVNSLVCTHDCNDAVWDVGASPLVVVMYHSMCGGGSYLLLS